MEKKFNQQFTNETLYSTRIVTEENGKTTEYKVSTIKNIYEEKNIDKLYKLFNTDECEKLLMFQHDIQTFTILKNIFNEYYVDNKINPFEEYRKISNEFPEKEPEFSMRRYNYTVFNADLIEGIEKNNDVNK